MTLPEFTYHVYALWPDDDLIGCETVALSDPNEARDNAFDVASNMIANGCDVTVERVERDAGRAMLVRDVTDKFLRARDMIQPSEDGYCTYCNGDPCLCDRPYEQAVSEQMHERMM